MRFNVSNVGVSFREKPTMFSHAVMLLCLSMAAIGCNRPSEMGKYANLGAADKIRTALVGDIAVAEGDAEVASTGWATIRGRFIFEGDPPQMPPYGVNKDQATCAPGGQAPPQETLVVDSATKGIANIAIYPRKVSRVHETAEPKTEPFVFDQENCVFLSHVFAVTVGQPIEIKNSDNVGHNTSIAGQNSFNQMVPSGDVTPFTPSREESIPVSISCSVHPWMRAYMLPRKNAYAAVTGEDGSFEIANLPAGEELEIQVWHESAAGGNGALFLDSDAAKELKWNNKGRFKIRLEPDEVRELNIPVPAAAFGG
jgi:plastocyanin